MDSSSKQARRLERLRQVRARGRWHFILWRGVVGWGVSTAVLYSLLMAWLEADRTFFDYASFALVRFPIVGFFWGAFMWWWSERMWQRLETNHPA